MGSSIDPSGMHIDPFENPLDGAQSTPPASSFSAPVAAVDDSLTAGLEQGDEGASDAVSVGLAWHAKLRGRE